MNRYRESAGFCVVTQPDVFRVMFSSESLTLVNRCCFDNHCQAASIIIEVKVIKVKHNETGSNTVEK